MLRLATNQAAPGMVLALPVLHPQKPGHLLLKPGSRLDADIIAALGELHVHTLWIEYPPTAFLLQYASPAIMAEHGKLATALGDQLRQGSRRCAGRLRFPHLLERRAVAGPHPRR